MNPTPIEADHSGTAQGSDRPTPARRNAARRNAARRNPARPDAARPNTDRPNTDQHRPARPVNAGAAVDGFDDSDGGDDVESMYAADRAMSQVPSSMRAIVQSSYGNTDCWSLEAVPVPSVGDDEVLIKVGAAGLDRGVWHLMVGEPYLVRPMFGLRRPRRPTPGSDVAGVVAAVGGSVTRFSVGDAVFGVGQGTFAEYCVAKEAKLAVKPSGVSFEQAGATPISGSTAFQGLVEVGRLQAGQRVLITGASGGVGSFAVQIAKALGAHVTGVASAAKLDFVRGLGADEVVAYGATEPLGTASTGSGFDLILDIAGNPSLSQLRGALNRSGTAVIVGGEGGGRVIGIRRQLAAVAVSPFVKQRLTMFIASEDHRYLDRLSGLINSGDVVPAVDETFALDHAAEAMRRLERGEARGKIIIVP